MKTLKIYHDGTQRVLPPEETIKKAKRFFKDFGITRIANITGLDRVNIPVAVANRPNSRSLAVSQGKGTSFESAVASAIMESIEIFHAERIFKPVQILSLEDFSNEQNVIQTQKLGRLSSSKFNSHYRIPWVKGRDLFTEKEVWVPFECVHTDYTSPWPHDHGNFIADSNGLASGNTLDEAINHALYEVIERDAMALWSLKDEHKKDAKKIKLKTINAPIIQKMLTQIIDADIEIGIWDITSDIEIPTYLCKIIDSRERENSQVRPAQGSGAHIDQHIALSRAITEAAQSRLTFIAGSRDDQYLSIYKQQSLQKTRDKWYSEILYKKENDNFKEYDFPENDYLEDDQAYILKKLCQVGLNQAVYVDLTRSTYNIPVVKVIVPGLEGLAFSGDRVVGERGYQEYQKSGVGACLKKIS